MHLAPAVGTPTIGIFGPSIPEIWFPYKEEAGHRLLIKDVDCRPCHQNECPIQHQCMDWITVDEVFITLTEILEKYGVHPSAFIWTHAHNEKDFNKHIEAARMGAWICHENGNSLGRMEAVGAKAAGRSGMPAKPTISRTARPRVTRLGIKRL